MKKLLLALAVVGATLFTACNKDQNCDHEFIEYDHNEALVGTWTYFEENGQAEAMVIKEDGSFAVTGIMAGGYMYESKGSINVVNNKVSLVFEGDKDIIEGRLELVAGKSLSIVLNEEYDIRLTYDYCANDLSDEVLGMWVCNDASTDAQDMMIQTFYEDGKCTLTGYLPLEGDSEQVKNEATDYKVIGDLLFITIPADKIGGEKPIYVVDKLIYTPNGTAYGDMLSLKTYIEIDGKFVESGWTYLRVKQYLNLDNKVYDYMSAYVTNAKGTDEDFTIGESTFNMSNIKGGDFDMMFRSVLSCFEFSANSFTYKFRSNDMDIEFATPITVDGNKVTLDMSKMNPACRTVVMHMFQDKDDSQLHMYMHTDAFINYFANVEVATLIAMGEINQTDEAAIAKVFADMEARVESINVSFVLKARN